MHARHPPSAILVALTLALVLGTGIAGSAAPANAPHGPKLRERTLEWSYDAEMGGNGTCAAFLCLNARATEWPTYTLPANASLVAVDLTLSAPDFALAPHAVTGDIHWQLTCQACPQPILASVQGTSPLRLQATFPATPFGAAIASEANFVNDHSAYRSDIHVEGTLGVLEDRRVTVPALRIETVAFAFTGNTGPCRDPATATCTGGNLPPSYTLGGPFADGTIQELDVTLTWDAHSPLSQQIRIAARCVAPDGGFCSPVGSTAFAQGPSPLRLRVAAPGWPTGSGVALDLSEAQVGTGLPTMTQQPFEAVGSITVGFQP